MAATVDQIEELTKEQIEYQREIEYCIATETKRKRKASRGRNALPESMTFESTITEAATEQTV